MGGKQVPCMGSHQVIFMTYKNKALSVNILRHSYINHIFENGVISNEKRKDIANKMGHTNETQYGYLMLEPLIYHHLQLPLLELNGLDLFATEQEQMLLA